MAPRSSTTPPKLIHLHILYTVSPATQTHFVRSRARVQVKQHAQLKGCPEKWASCPVGEVVKAMLGKSPDLIPNSREDHSLHFNSPRDTYREALYSAGGDDAPPIEVQMGLVGWALDDTSEESKAMVMGVLRKDEVETEGSDEEEDEDAEEWLELRLRLAKTKPISHAQHLSLLGHLQRGETPPPLPAPPPVQASPVTRSQSHQNASASSSTLTPFAAPASSRATKTGGAASSRAKATPSGEPAKRPRGRPPKAAAVAKPGPTKRKKMLEEAAAESAAALALTSASTATTASEGSQPPSAATMVEQLLAVLKQTQSQDGSPVLTPDLLNSIKQIQGGSADSETNRIIQSILSVHSASNGSVAGAKLGPAGPALTASAVDQLPTPSTSGPSTASGSRSGDMGPPAQDDAASRLRRLTAGKGKENAPLSSGGATGSDATMTSATSSASKKRKAIEQEEGCENCGATKSFAWRRKEGSGKVCNACGIYWNRYKSKRPRELWGEPEPPFDPKELLDKRTARLTRASLSAAPSPATGLDAAATPSAGTAGTSTAAPTNAHQQMLPSLPPSPYNLRTSPARLDAARARAQAFLPMTSPLRAGKVSLLPLTSPVRAIKRSAVGVNNESPRTALKRVLNGGSQIALSRLHKPLSDDGVRDMTLTPGSDSKMKSSSIARGLPATGSSVGLGDEDMDLGGDGGGDDWLHSDFSSYFSFNEDDDELLNGSNADTPRTNRTIDSSVMGSSPFLAPFDFSTLPPSSPPTVSAELMSSPDTQRDFNSPLPPLGDDPSPAPSAAAHAMAAHAGHLDLDTIKTMFQSNSPASTSSATTIPTSTGAGQPTLDGVAVAGGHATSKAEQLDLLRIWESCQGVMGKPVVDGHTPGSDTNNGTGDTPPTWVTE